MSVLPRRARFGMRRGSASHEVRSTDLHPRRSATPACLLLHQCRNELKEVAGVGSAPTSSDFQPAAHLSEPSSVLIEEMERVPRRGDAPRSSGYQPGALLLSYRGCFWKNGGAPENCRSCGHAKCAPRRNECASAQALHSGRLCRAQRFSGPFSRLCRTWSFLKNR